MEQTTYRCPRCEQQIDQERMPAHNKWHYREEGGLEKPKTDAGFWDPDGRWNITSTHW